MNWKTFRAMLARDAHVARRNLAVVLVQTMLQPLMFVFVFGQVMVRSGMMVSSYKAILLPGIMGVAMTFSGVQAVAMPLLAEFQFTREIEDRLLAPMRMEWLVAEKIIAGMVQALISGGIVVPAAWLLLGRDVGISLPHPWLFAAVVLLVALFSAAGGLTLGVSMARPISG